jgi:predicted Rossmann fold flavoprotein
MGNNPKPRIIVVGAGAAGMMAAGAAAASGARVLLLEKMQQPGRKLAITGKGRCNLTNICEIREFIDHFGRNGKFLHQTFHHFFNRELVDFFTANGLETVNERGGRVFPASGKAPEVVKVMRDWLKKSGVTTRLNSPVEKLLFKNEKLIGVLVDGEEFPAAAVILTTGGASYPKTGSTGDGYLLAESVGHTIVPPQPALVPLICTDHCTREAQDLSLRNVGVSLLIDKKKRKDIFGEIMFTADGVSGPTVLTLSRLVVAALNKGSDVELVLDLKPALDEHKLDARLIRDFHRRGKENLESILRGLIPKELLHTCLSLTGIDARRQGHQVTAKERKHLRQWLKEWHLQINGHRPLAEAIITAGGVALKEINPKTMASYKIENLFIAGELLDLQADTGGYNLQAAFSTGHLAGISAAQSIS